MRLITSIFSVAAVAFLAGSCRNMDYRKTRGGIPYKIISASGKGDSVHPNSIVKFEVIQKVKDSVLFSSYKEGMAQYTQVQLSGGPAYNDAAANINEILSKTKKGDSIYYIQSVDSLIKQSPEILTQTKLKRGDQITTGIRILDIYKSPAEANAAVLKDRLANAENMEKESLSRFKSDTAAQAQITKDSKIIEDYLKANNIQAQKTTWGVYVQTLNPGQGSKPAIGQYANIKYKGTDLAGKEFDAGVFPLQIGVGGSIKGFEEGAKQLSKGGHAKVYIPSILAYGPRGSAPKIGPNENLLFDMEVLDISNTPPAQPQPAAPTSDSTARH